VGEKKDPEAFKVILSRELSEPLTFIREKFGNKPWALAYPYGVYDPRILESTKETGYTMAFTVDPGPNDRTLPPLQLRRNLILYPMKHEAFARIFQEKVLHLEELYPGDGEIIDKKKPVITGVLADDLAPKSLTMQLGQKNLSLRYDAKTRRFRHRVNAPLKAGGHMVTLKGTDRQGQKRTYTWYFRVKHRNLQKEEENDLPTVVH